MTLIHASLLSTRAFYFTLAPSFLPFLLLGWRRTMEDAHIVNLDIDGQGTALYGVFDGERLPHFKWEGGPTLLHSRVELEKGRETPSGPGSHVHALSLNAS